MFNRTLRAKLVPICLGMSGALAMVGAADASAATLFVSNSAPVVVGGRSCAQPGFNSIQTAIATGGLGAKIAVCPGTYTEELTIVRAVKLSAAGGPGTATVAMPAAPTASSTKCSEGLSEPQLIAVAICTGETVSITGVDVEAIVPLTACTDGLYGIFIGGGGTLKATDMAVDGASTSLDEYKGCQHGVAIAAGLKPPTPEVGHAVLKDVTVSGYEKNGPTVRGAGSTLSVDDSTITGEGPSPWIAQNGIEVAYGAAGTVKSSTVSGNECDVPVCTTDEEEQATGVLFYGAAAGSGVSSSTLEQNDIGGYYDSTSVSQPEAAEVTFAKDTVASNRYEGFVLEQGKALLNKDTIDGGGKVGIDLVQTKEQSLASQSSAIHTKVEDQTEAAIRVESDKSTEDKKGSSFVFADGTFSGNGTVLDNESNDFEVVL
ncbi:MAG TPA: right-handed parallel beta-helix repeat-containing protein [Solirubrobacteraceae bacterium]|nr:right-handed parallel beta-helix repeat-containing protein [Solirubrobacteraceae bacterium]